MALSIRNVCMTFDVEKGHTLEDINLNIAPGEFVCLLGPSGCGKSTLLNIIAGLEKPTSGEVYMNELPITAPGPDRAMMFQESALFPWLTVEENIKFGMRLAKLPKEEQEARAVKYEEMTGLRQFASYNVHKLSGGMKQRCALARALCLDSEVLLMDEPFAALDKQTKNILCDELEKIWLHTKKTIVYVTHSVEEGMFFGDKIVMFSANPGKIKKIINVGFPRPRRIDDPEFVHLRHEILEELKSEIKNN